MTDLELHQLRREKWRLDGKPIRTIEEARAFVESVGFCLMYPVRPTMPVPTFIGAFVGSDDRLPTWQHAFSDPRALAATEMMVRLLRERAAYEANLVEENNAFLVAASVFPDFYALVGERNPKLAPKQGPSSPYSPLARDAFELVRSDGPISKQKLQELLGGSVSLPALDKALGELAAHLRINRVDYSASEGSVWDLLYRWAPEAVREGVQLSVPAALSALVSKYLACVIAAEQAELETFFGNFAARSRVKEAINALIAARELSFVHVNGKSMLQLTPEKEVTTSAPRPVVPVNERTREAFRPESYNRPGSYKKSFPAKRSFSRQPNSGQPNSDRPSSGQRSSGRPSFQRPVSERPNSERPNFGRPSSERPNFSRADSGRPNSARPNSGRPNSSRPSSERPSDDRRSSGRPSSRRPSSGRPSSSRPPSGRPSSGRPASGRPPSGRAPSNRPPSDRSSS
jgi:hypothetical protein